jgi:hypothetical protein
MKRRIFGLESEYGITCTRQGRPVLTPEVLARYLFDEIAASPLSLPFNHPVLPEEPRAVGGRTHRSVAKDL